MVPGQFVEMGKYEEVRTVALEALASSAEGQDL
jgi:hypothetical protein